MPVEPEKQETHVMKPKTEEPPKPVTKTESTKSAPKNAGFKLENICSNLKSAQKLSTADKISRLESKIQQIGCNVQVGNRTLNADIPDNKITKMNSSQKPKPEVKELDKFDQVFAADINKTPLRAFCKEYNI